LHDLLVTRLGGADEVVVTDVEQPPGLLVFLGDQIDEGLRRHPLGLRGALQLLAVLVGAGQVKDVLFAAPQPLVAREGVPDDGRVGMANVWNVRDVIDRRREIKAVAGGS
jgi:hypothetical protein